MHTSTGKHISPAPTDNKPGSEFQDSLLRAIRDASPDGILVVDARDHVVSLNQRFLDVWGILGAHHSSRVGDIIGTPDQADVDTAMARMG